MYWRYVGVMFVFVCLFADGADLDLKIGLSGLYLFGLVFFFGVFLWW